MPNILRAIAIFFVGAAVGGALVGALFGLVVGGLNFIMLLALYGLVLGVLTGLGNGAAIGVLASVTRQRAVVIGAAALLPVLLTVSVGSLVFAGPMLDATLAPVYAALVLVHGGVAAYYLRQVEG